MQHPDKMQLDDNNFNLKKKNLTVKIKPILKYISK